MDIKWIVFSQARLFTLFIGAYQIGDTASCVDSFLLSYIITNEVHVRYDDMGSELVKRSVALGQPMIFVSFNYRYVNKPMLDLSHRIRFSWLFIRLSGITFDDM